jgi:hypothetical protein
MVCALRLVSKGESSEGVLGSSLFVAVLVLMQPYRPKNQGEK